MKLLLVFLIFLMLSGCNKSTGTAEVKLIDVEWSGRVFKTCEVNLQYGDSSSQMRQASSESQGMCENLVNNVGKHLTMF